MMKTNIFTTFLAVMLLIMSVNAQSKVITSINFNDSSQIELKNGALISDRGVSGKPEDKAFVSEVKNLEDPANSPVAQLVNSPQVNGLGELTVSLWFKASDKQVKDSSLFNAGALYLISDGKGSWTLRVEADAEKGVMNWFMTGGKGPYLEWTKPNEWVFAAFAWKKSTNEVCFYQGTTKNPVKLQRCQKRTEQVGGLKQRAAGDKRLDAIGNTLDTKYHRPFNGSIDNFRYFRESLSIENVENIRQADLKNENPVL